MVHFLGPYRAHTSFHACKCANARAARTNVYITTQRVLPTSMSGIRQAIKATNIAGAKCMQVDKATAQDPCKIMKFIRNMIFLFGWQSQDDHRGVHVVY